MSPVVCAVLLQHSGEQYLEESHLCSDICWQPLQLPELPLGARIICTGRTQNSVKVQPGQQQGWGLVGSSVQCTKTKGRRQRAACQQGKTQVTQRSAGVRREVRGNILVIRASPAGWMAVGVQKQVTQRLVGLRGKSWREHTGE